jgi:catechol 2,3-dioxygenase-like lactoylglutathione lyase family enzyme
MRLDHLAYRVADRDETVKFFMDAFGYKFQAEFEIYFNDEKTDKALCIALEPPEKVDKDMGFICHYYTPERREDSDALQYHLAPEIFVSQGTPGSIVYDWVQQRGGIGGIHHLAYQVESVESKMKEWKEKGWGDFTSQEVMRCPGLKQIFSKPHSLTGIIFEFIEREGFGFCQSNVRQLMESTKEFSEVKVYADANMH